MSKEPEKLVQPKKEKTKRQGHNRGTVVKRSDGRWAGAVYWGYSPTGKVQRKWVYGKTQAEVGKKLKKAQAVRDAGLPIPADRISVERFLLRWLKDSVDASDRRPKTRTHYHYICEQHLIPSLGRIKLAKLSVSDVEGMLNAKAKNLSPRTVRHILTALRRALKIAMKWDLLTRNVASLVDAPGEKPNAEGRTYTPEQMSIFLSAIENDPLECLYIIAIVTGMRQGEILGLRWTDVDLDSATLNVSRSVQRVESPLKKSSERNPKTALKFSEPKTARGRREIPLPDSALAALREHKKAQLERKMMTGSYWKEQGLVFPTSIGTPMDARNLVRHYYGVVETINEAEKAAAERERRDAQAFPRLPFHCLRHYAATGMLRAGVPARIAADVLGHASTLVTLDTYSHVVKESRREAVQHSENLITQKKK